MSKATQLGTIRFELDDYREMKYNESVDCTFGLWGDPEDEALSMEDYYHYCKYFAAAMGFASATINEWFGDL